MIHPDEILSANILIVDDQEANIELLIRVLTAAGYTNLHSCTQPAEVSALHKSADFDLILLDLQMPVMDGFEVMHQLKAQTADNYIPVIVLTAQPSHKLRALQAGAKDFISKPFDLAEVKTRIHNMLEVRLLYKKLADFNRLLEQKVLERTAELRESEARYRGLTELASDWYWEQDEHDQFIRVSGPVREMLGLQMSGVQEADADLAQGWDPQERAQLRNSIAAREPFLDFVFHRNHADGSTQRYRVSGEPMFNLSGRFLGYRGIGVEITDGTQKRAVQGGEAS